MAPPLFDGRSLAKKIEDAKSLLEENGYLVRGPLILKKDVRTPAELMKFFYDRMAFYNPNMVVAYSSLRKRDLSLAKNFIDARQESGISRDRAVAECCEIIETLFRHEDRLGLNFKITSMSILGQEALGWITDKAVDIINNYNFEIAADKENAWFDKFYNNQEDNLSDKLVQEANKRLGIEEKNGKEED